MKRVPLFGLFECEVQNDRQYRNPFADAELNAAFTAPSGRSIDFPGFFDGDGRGGQEGNVWKQRFMPDEIGEWSYRIAFSDGSPGASGGFECVEEGARPGFWTLDPENPRWFRTARGERFLPIAMHASCALTPIDWRDAIEWCTAYGFNTLVTRTMNHSNWGEGWPNVTAFAAANAATREVDYDRMNIPMWRQWDQMIQAAGEAGIYIGPFDGPCGKYGGQERKKYPPTELVMNPGIKDRFDTERNLRIIRYLVARQGAFWNLAYWALGATEIYCYCVADEREFLDYGEYFASLTPWGRMITAQDCEQWHGENRRWMSRLDIPVHRKLNTVQTSIENPDRPSWGHKTTEGGWIDQPVFQDAAPNNELALDSYGGFPMLCTEGLWEGQGRAKKPLRIIWGFLCAGGHVMWADWSYENPEDHTYGSIGRSWVPVKPLDRHLFGLDQLGADCVGHRQLRIALDVLGEMEYWRMDPHNEFVKGSDEAYCLAEPGRQYLVYAPNGGTVRVNAAAANGNLRAQWLDPRTGDRLEAARLAAGTPYKVDAPGHEDWVLVVSECRAKETR